VPYPRAAQTSPAFVAICRLDSSRPLAPPFRFGAARTTALPQGRRVPACRAAARRAA
jgi:hypothetical protein